MLREHQKEQARQTIEDTHAVHSAVAPFHSTDGGKHLKNFLGSLQNMISPRRPVDPLREIKDRAKKRNAEKRTP